MVCSLKWCRDTAAIGCAAATGIPLTHRGLSRSVTLVTGHVQMAVSFTAGVVLVKAGGTLVFYMGLERATGAPRTVANGCTG